MDTAGRDTTVGGALGGAVGLAAPAAGEGIRRAIQHMRGPNVRAIGDGLNVSPAAARSVRSGIAGEDLGQAAPNIGRGGPDAMLLEAGPSTRAMGDAVARVNGAAGRIMQDAVAERPTRAAARYAPGPR